jgi:NTP pyrophosphatase (non-canonical NTP hydrolase)
MTLTFDQLTQVSQERRDVWHPQDTTQWSGADWSNATMGEVGELVEVIELLAFSSAITKHSGVAANLVKKIRRHDTSLGEKIPRDELISELGKEMADVVGYLVVLADHYDLDLGDEVAKKFNEVSIRQGFPQRLPVKSDPIPTAEFPEPLSGDEIEDIVQKIEDSDKFEPGWTCQCSHNSMIHDRVQTRTIYPCTECDCTNMTPAEEA